MSLLVLAISAWTLVIPDGWRRAPELDDQSQVRSTAAQARHEVTNIYALEVEAYEPTDDPARGAMVVSSVSFDMPDASTTQIEDAAVSAESHVVQDAKSRSGRWIGKQYVVVIDASSAEGLAHYHQRFVEAADDTVYALTIGCVGLEAAVRECDAAADRVTVAIPNPIMPKQRPWPFEVGGILGIVIVALLVRRLVRTIRATQRGRPAVLRLR